MEQSNSPLSSRRGTAVSLWKENSSENTGIESATSAGSQIKPVLPVLTHSSTADALTIIGASLPCSHTQVSISVSVTLLNFTVIAKS